MSGVSIACPGHLCAALRPLQAFQVRMGELSYLHFPLCLWCTPPDITEGGQERLFGSTRLGPGLPCAERCWTELLRRLPWGTEVQCWFCSALSRPSEKRESLRKESIEIAPCQRSSRFGNEWRNSWWYMLADPQMRLSKDTHLLRHRRRSKYLYVRAFSPLALEQLCRPCPSLLLLLGSPSVARI